MLSLKLLKHADKTRGRDRGINLNMKRFSVEIVCHVECAVPLTGMQ